MPRENVHRDDSETGPFSERSFGNGAQRRQDTNRLIIWDYNLYIDMHLHLNKPALRVLGIAESFVRSLPTSVLAGVVMRADLRVDGMAIAHATVSGDDATNAVLRIYEQLDRADVNAIVLSGVA